MLPKQIIVSLLALSLFAALPSLAAEPTKSAKTSEKTQKSASKPVVKAETKSVAKPESKPESKTVTSAAAKSPAVAADSQTWTGYLVDRSCAAAIKGDNKDAMKSVKEHTKACSLEPSCCEAGYSVYSQGQWIDLDNAGNVMAKKVMQATKRDKAHMVKVVGIIKRGEVRPSSIVEVN